MTTNPQKIKNANSKGVEELNKKKGETKQHKQDRDNAIAAIFFVPKR